VKVLVAQRDAAELLATKDSQHGATPLGWCCHGSRIGNATHDHTGVARLLL